jgi:hypothetical protein
VKRVDEVLPLVLEPPPPPDPNAPPPPTDGHGGDAGADSEP